jgi:hypothetical protein
VSTWGIVDIEGNLKAYLLERNPSARYTSFDYCFNYFQSHREQAKLPDLLHGHALELSCLHIGFYLASWGMLRGSSELLQRSVRNFVPLVEAIANAPPAVWEMDAHMYGDGTCPLIFETARSIEAALPDGASDILVTKVMLGTFGCVPAFDTYFKKGFGVSTFGRKALNRVGAFYNANAEVIERNRVHTLEFGSGAASQRRYTRAKVIDMIFFVAGRS